MSITPFRRRLLFAACSLLGLGALLPAQIFAADCTMVHFRRPDSYVVGGSPYHAVTADFNGDGLIDFATTDDAGGTAVVYYRDPAGKFTAPSIFPAGGFPQALATGDFNGDGKPDLAIASGLGSGSGVEVLLNNGDGTFPAPAHYTTGTYPFQIVAADFNGDGKLDLAVLDDENSNLVVLLGNGDGTFGRPITTAAHALQPLGMVAGDFDEDGKLDLAISNYTTQNFEILHGDGTGHFTIIQTYSLPGNASTIVTGDFNHDGHLDVAVGVFNIGASGMYVYFGVGDGSFGFVQSIPTPDAQGIVAADFNGDGYLDLATVTYGFNSVEYALGDGAGTFGTPISRHIPGRGPLPYGLATGDFDGDGNPDVVTANYGNGTASVILSVNCKD